LSRLLFYLSLIAILSGPLLRAAEGADDLSRSLAELGRPPLFEEADGGVGDDQGDSVIERAVRFEPAFARVLSWDVWATIGRPKSLVVAPPPFVPDILASQGNRQGSLPLGASHRQAWLQLFLF
jgi:hypothetical protein